MRPDTLAALLAAREAGQAVVLATRLSDGRQMLLPGGDAPPDVREAARLALERDESRMIELGAEAWFLNVFAPAFRLIIVGAVHIAQALAPLATALGYAVTVVDPRRSFATEERFPGVALVHDWPDTGLDGLKLDARTGIVMLTHDPKLDDPALDRALRSPALFIGALGSRKSHAARLVRLEAMGHTPADLARIRGPVGLALGAVSTPEIALSIVAELVATRRGSALAQR
jgi:xanthine dehydrogenase accessory factor